MKAIWLIMVLLAAASAVWGQAPCLCKTAGEKDVTATGGSPYTLEMPGVYASIAGRVLDKDGDPLADVLVEVWDHPGMGAWFGDKKGNDAGKGEDQGGNKEGGKKAGKPSEKDRQKRLAACRVGEDGRFCFSAVPDGEYEVRFSLADYDAVISFVKVRTGEKPPPSGKNSDIEVFLSPSD